MLDYLCLFVLCCVLNLCLPKKYAFSILKSKTVNLGTLPVDEITIFEWKPLCSIKTFYFNKGDAQEIFHTHSFSAISILLHGNYIESFYDAKTGTVHNENRNRSTIIYISEDKFHQITKSEGCRTIMITGPWGDTYKEYNPDTKEIIISTHGRREIQRYKAH